MFHSIVREFDHVHPGQIDISHSNVFNIALEQMQNADLIRGALGTVPLDVPTVINPILDEGDGHFSQAEIDALHDIIDQRIDHHNNNDNIMEINEPDDG